MGDTPYARLAGVYDDYVVDPCHASWADFLEDLWSGDDVVEVLDVCCGTGLMTTELVSRGHHVVGIDASPEMLELARTLLGPDVRLEQVVLPDLPLDDVFDAAVSTLDGLNYLTLPDFQATMRAVHGRLRPGGWFVFDLHAEAALPFMHENPVLEGEQDGIRFVLSSTVDDAARACTTTIELTAPDPADSFSESHVQYVHSDLDVRAALAAAGFTSIHVTDEYTSDPVVDGTLRATWVARRPAESRP